MRTAILGLALLLTMLPAAGARAFCGFFVAGSNSKLTNNASQVAILRKGNRTSLTMQNNYRGPPEDFAMVVPVPVVLQAKDVKTLRPDVFEHLDTLSAPRLVEYWEQDPCAFGGDFDGVLGGMAGAGSGRGYGSGGGGLAARESVRVEAQFAVGEYEILVLSADESNGLERWLRAHRYHIPAGAAEALAPYVAQQMKFFVAKVDIGKVKKDADGTVVLSPLRVTYESPEVRLPVRLGLINANGANGKQDLVVYLLSPTRATRSRTTRTCSSPPTSRSSTACASTSPRSTPSSSTR